MCAKYIIMRHFISYMVSKAARGEHNMTGMNAQYYIDELYNDIQQQDPIKAAVLLSYFHGLAPQLQHRVLV